MHVHQNQEVSVDASVPESPLTGHQWFLSRKRIQFWTYLQDRVCVELLTVLCCQLFLSPQVLQKWGVMFPVQTQLGKGLWDDWV